MDNNSKNYEDAIMKKAWDTFAKEGRSMFGLLKKVVGEGKSNLVSLDLKFFNLDYLYELEDGTFEHFEFQSTNNNTADLQRFAAYDAVLTQQTGKEVYTYVIYSAGIKNPTTQFKNGFNTYQIKALTLANINGDQKSKELFDKVKRGDKLTDEDALNTMFLPLTGGNRSVRDKILDSVKLAKYFNQENAINLEAMAYAMAIKFLKESDLDTIKEAIKMTTLGKMLIEDGRAEGKIEGKIEAAISLLDILNDQTIAERFGLDLEQVKTLRQNHTDKK